jgi:hypothetical protein
VENPHHLRVFFSPDAIVEMLAVFPSGKAVRFASSSITAMESGMIIV